MGRQRDRSGHAKLHRRASSGTLELNTRASPAAAPTWSAFRQWRRPTSHSELRNQTVTPAGTQLGSVNAGDDLIVLRPDVTDTSLRYYTNPSLNPDRANHAGHRPIGRSAVPASSLSEDLAIRVAT